MSPQIEIQLIAIIVAIACSLPGVFLVLRSMAMMSDAITHTILLGIVLAFFIVSDLNSPFLIMGAALIGLLTVYLVEKLYNTRLMSEDAAIGVVFPLLFSIAIILVSRYAGQVHIDTDAVLLGEIAFAPFNRLTIGNFDFGPVAIYTMGVILILNLVFIILFFKELKLSIFDPALAATLGFSPVILKYALMASVSITTVGAFESVGSILVIAFMIGPPITAYLLTDDLRKMLYYSAGIATLNAIVGYQVANIGYDWGIFDVSIAGMMATATGVTFFIVLILAPERGLITVFNRRRLQRIDFAKKAILFHIYRHENRDNAYDENGVYSIHKHLNLNASALTQYLESLVSEQKLSVTDDVYVLTENGRTYTSASYAEFMEQGND